LSFPESVYVAESGEAGVAEFIRRLTFSALIGNADMHLKNVSLIDPDRRRAALAPMLRDAGLSRLLSMRSFKGFLTLSLSKGQPHPAVRRIHGRRTRAPRRQGRAPDPAGARHGAANRGALPSALAGGKEEPAADRGGDPGDRGDLLAFLKRLRRKRILLTAGASLFWGWLRRLTRCAAC